MLANAGSFHLLLVAAAMVGVGSAVFHPEASRVARMASGGRHGLAQSLFQVGGNVGSAIGPILAAFIVIPRGQGSVGWFSGAALVAMTVLFGGRQLVPQGACRAAARRVRGSAPVRADLSRAQGRLVAGDPVGADLLQIVLSGEPQQLLHLLSDQQIRRVGRERADPPVRVSRLDRGRHADRRAGRRPDRAQIRDLGLDRRGHPVHAGAALCRAVLDRDPDRRDRADPRVGDLGDRRLRARPRAGKDRHDLRDCSSACRSGSPGSARPCSASWPTRPASTRSTRSARFCR